LPHDRRFGQSTQVVRELLGRPLKENTYQRSDTRKIDRRYLRVIYSRAGKVEKLAVGLPWKGFP
jgi:hypothetical protein